MEKYQKLFIERMNKTFEQWNEKRTIEESVIYRFLHTLKGTAASIGLEDLSKEAEKKLEQLNESGTRIWSQEEWQSFLQFCFLSEFKAVTESDVDRLEEKVQKVTENEKLLLLIDDDITMVNYLKEKLEQEGYMVLAALTADKALKLFYDQKPDCILLDIHLPDENGLELLDAIVEKSKAYFIPIILLSSVNDIETRMRGYKKGAVDFIEKPFNLEELKVRVENRIQYKELVSNAVLIDELTGAFNRKFLKLELSKYLFAIDRTKEVLSIALLDLDHFKKVNDTYGHGVGDIVLKGFAQFIMKNKRQSDYLVRYGGEEFILLLPNTNGKDAVSFMERLIHDFSLENFPGENGKHFSVTFSAGVVQIDNPQIHIEEYVKRADTALYQAKENGRNQVCYYEETRKMPVANKFIHIGIIDDDPIVHSLITDRLSKLTIGNIQADYKSFREGESFFASDWHKQNGKFLILLDGIMPRMDGLEVLRKLREEYLEEKYIVLMLTGRKSEKDIVKALELGADDYLTKPFSVVELEARVKRLVKRMLI